MFEIARPVFLYVETPLHPGAGSGLGHVDLPIQREVHSKLPTMQGSGIKGTLREAARRCVNKDFPEEHLFAIFGPETAEANVHSGAVSFSDARLLCFPIRSLNGLFAWTTCPLALARLKDDLALAGQPLPDDLKTPNLSAGNCLLPNPCEVSVRDNNVVLEDAVLTGAGDCSDWAGKLSQLLFPNAADDDYWKSKFEKSLVVLSDTDFGDLVQRGTEVITRIRINTGTGTVERGGLWTEEHLPADTIMYSLALVGKPTRNGCNKSAQESWEALHEQVLAKCSRLQFGGDETTGKGLVRLVIGGD